MKLTPVKLFTTAVLFSIVPIAYAQDDGLTAAERGLEYRATHCAKEGTEEKYDETDEVNRETNISVTNPGTEQQKQRHTRITRGLEKKKLRCRK